jgi:hypothetical protein
VHTTVVNGIPVYQQGKITVQEPVGVFMRPLLHR